MFKLKRDKPGTYRIAYDQHGTFATVDIEAVSKKEARRLYRAKQYFDSAYGELIDIRLVNSK